MGTVGRAERVVHVQVCEAGELSGKLRVVVGLAGGPRGGLFAPMCCWRLCMTSRGAKCVSGRNHSKSHRCCWAERLKLGKSDPGEKFHALGPIYTHITNDVEATWKKFCHMRCTA